RLADRIGIMKDGRLVQMATPEQMIAAPADDYVRAFTKNAPRDRILTVGAIAGKAKGKTGGKPIEASVKIGDAAAQVLSSDHAIPVIDGQGKAIGAVTREGMIAALFPESGA
ncbi:MAG: glycine betaine/L-proline ABC transporter ATP-binding protein, partial [Rhizobiales bacterium]|nr:glycine betaine/L-proline ABC transporter ATP-binding protein [Hyphomicrobiales bacterium]